MSCELCGDTLRIRRFRSAGYDRPPVEDFVACPRCVPEWAEVEAMTEEQVTLHLARQGISPEDTRRGLERVMRRIEEEKAKGT